MKASTAVVNDQRQDYPKEMVGEQLEQLYRVEISRVMRELYRLLPDYRTRVAGETYKRDRAKLMLVRAYLCGGPMGPESLKTSLQYLSRQQQVFATALSKDT